MNEELEMNEEMLCPKCNAKINYLIETRFSEAYYHVYPAGDVFDATLQEYGDDFKEPEYHCPDCDTLLTTGEENAKLLFTNPMNNPEHIELLNEKLKQDEQDNLKQEYEEQ